MLALPPKGGFVFFEVLIVMAFSPIRELTAYALDLGTAGTRRSDQGNLGRNWRRCLVRAAKVKYYTSLSIAFGYIGYSDNRP